MSDDPLLVTEPMTDEDLDEIEEAAFAIMRAVQVKDFDSAYIIASTCTNPVMLAMFMAEINT